MRKAPLTMHWFLRMVLVAAIGCIVATALTFWVLKALNVSNLP